MLSVKEKNFVDYWQNNRLREKSLARQLLFGLPFGLLLGSGVLILFESGWYERATMVAYSQSSPWMLILAILLITVFTGYFYKKHQWEMNEQRYRELLVKKNKPGTGV